MENDNKVMTPEEFKNEMENIIKEYNDDPEVLHSAVDSLMYEVLESLGYEEGLKLSDDAEKWYG